MQLVEGDGFLSFTLGPARCACLFLEVLLVASQCLQLLLGSRLVQPGRLFAGKRLVEEACGGLLHQRDLLPQGQIPSFNPLVLGRALGLPGVLARPVEATFGRVAFEDGDRMGVDAREIAAAVGRPAIGQAPERSTAGNTKRQMRVYPGI